MAADATPLLRLNQVESAYGLVKAIRGVSLQVHAGEICALLGSNGAGKTTTLKTISGVLDPLQGTIEFDGRDIARLDAAEIVRLGLCHVPEGREVFPLLSVHDNLLMGGYARPDRREAARDLERVYGYFPVLRERARQPAGLLSGGQQQMLALSRAIMAAPRLILLDEPSLGLSPRLTQEIFEIVMRINREHGTSILLVEQNANMALNVADRAYIMENGRIMMEGTCAELRERADIKAFYLGVADGASAPRRAPLAPASVWR
jgi:branched-chain amino acid transport system ATP-binding protein